MKRGKKNLTKNWVITCLVVLALLSISMFAIYRLNKGFTGFAVFTSGPGLGQTTLTLQEANSENLGDAYVNENFANRNYGTSTNLETERNPYKRIYIKFNISFVPQGQIIDNSKLCLYMYNDQASQTIHASHVYVNDWNEGTENNVDVSGQDYKTNITWNNQPCGANFDNSTNCNLTSESSLSNDGSKSGTWQCWNVTNAVSYEYNSGSKKVSIVLYTNDIGNSDMFYSKEHTNASLRPYLNITYRSNINTTYVNSSFDESTEGWGITHFKNISSALSAVMIGGTVNVSSGVYNEKFLISKSVNLVGAGLEKTRIHGGETGHVIEINTEKVNVSGFTITGSGSGWSDSGIYLNGAGYSIISNNNFSGNNKGIEIINAYNNTVHSNYVVNSVRHGIRITNWASINNYFYNNYLDNSDNWYGTGHTNNFFNITKTLGTNIVGGEYIGGNYWSDYSGVNRGDGFGDTAYFVEGSYYDYLPLVENTAPVITIYSPENSNYFHNQEISLNYSVYDSDEDLDSCWYNLNQGNNLTLTSCENTTFYAPVGSHTLFLYANDSTGYLSVANVSFNSTNTAPEITIIEPSEGTTYGYNHSIALKFSINDLEEDKESCWYGINGGENITISNCQNTTFNVSGNTEYTLTIYVNDSLGEKSTDSVGFKVSLGAPTITTNSPLNEEYFSNKEINFYYTPSDIDLEVCSLWGNFDGEWKINQTNFSPLNGFENVFSINISDGAYIWSIECNDTEGNFAFSGNKTLYIDTTPPLISITEPQGTKSSRTNIPFTFSIVDASPVICMYNVLRGTNYEIINTTFDCSENSRTFSVTVDADFILNLYVNDSAGNLNFANSSFSVSTSTSPPPSSGGSSGGGSSGGTVAITLSSISAERISGLIVNPGDKKTIFWKVRNTGIKFVNDCVFRSKGAFSSWITHTERKNLAAGEEYEFVFDLNIPKDANSGEYNISVILECPELFVESSFIAEIIEKQIHFELIEIRRDNAYEIAIVYKITEASGENQDVDLHFILFDSKNEKVADKKEEMTILANSENVFETKIPVPSSLKGEVNFLVNLNSKTYSSFIQESAFIGSPLSGFAVRDFATPGNTVGGAIIILFVIFAFFMIKKILAHKKVINLKKKK